MNIKLICTVVMAFCVTMGSYAQGDAKWDFPIKPGTEEWKQLKTTKEMVGACQIPENVLNALTTRELAEICYNYPLFIDYMLVNDPQDFIYHLPKQFNGIAELLEREDGVDELACVFLDCIYTNGLLVANGKNLTRKNSILRVDYLETMLSNDEFLKHLSTKKIAILKEKCHFVYMSKRMSKDNYGLASLKCSLTFLCKLIDKEQSPNGQPGSTTARSEKTSAEHIRLALSAEELDVILATMIN